MLSPKRAAPLLCITAFTLILLYLRTQDTGRTWRDVPTIPADGDFITDEPVLITSSLLEDHSTWPNKPLFLPGTPKPPGSNYTRALVIASTSTEDVSWITTDSLYTTPFIYTVDSPTSPLRTPKNKGHEVMVYLTYIITHYATLPDITLFMHAHRHSWHNNELLNHDAAEMIRRLSSEHVLRSGFVNLRCHWSPGCPDWMHPGVTEDDINKQEETLMVQAWAELFPGEPAPLLLAQPCCAQFAKEAAKGELDGYLARVDAWRDFREGVGITTVPDGKKPEVGRVEVLKERVAKLEVELEEKRNAAVERGAYASVRAQVAGRPWSDGDGF